MRNHFYFIQYQLQLAVKSQSRSNMAGVRGGLWPAAFLLLTADCKQSHNGKMGRGRAKDKHWSMLSAAMISLVYRPFPELPKLNDLHTNHSAAVSIYSGNISIEEIKPYKPILIMVMLPFMITRATFFTSGRHHYSCGIQNNNHLPWTEPQSQH